MSELKEFLTIFVDMLLELEIRILRLERRFSAPLRQMGCVEARRVPYNSVQSDHMDSDQSDRADNCACAQEEPSSI